MLITLFNIFGLFIAGMMLVSKSTNEVFYFFLALLLVPPGVLFFGMPSNWFIIILCVLGFFKRPDFFRILRTFPIINACLYFSVLVMLIGVFDARGTFSYRFLKPISFLASNILISIYIYFALYNSFDYDKLYRKFFLLFLFVGAYGFLCFLTNNNAYTSAIANDFNTTDFNAAYTDADDSRGRISSFFFHPYIYALVLYMVVLILFCFYFVRYKTRAKFKKRAIIGLLLFLGANIYFTGSRTVYIILFLSIVMFIILRKGREQLFNYTLLFSFLLVFILQIPEVDTATQKISDSFSETKGSGSSIQLRERQFFISLGYFAKSPLFGNGFNYINDNLGFNSDIKKRRSDEEAAGFESYIFQILIEQGVAGIIANIILFYAIIKFHFKSLKKRKPGKVYDFLVISMIVSIGYIMFILMTGELNSMPIFFSFLGISISYQMKLKPAEVLNASPQAVLKTV